MLHRSEYFKTALSTSVGTNNKVLNVEECSSRVLATAVDFIYGIGIPEDFSSEDAKSLLAMADLYLMEDLKDAVGPLIFKKETNRDNILEISKMAEKYSAQKLKELCCEFIFKNIKTLDKKTLMELYQALPLLGEMLWLAAIDGKSQDMVDLANKVLGINLKEPFKKRGDFQLEDDYRNYVLTCIKPNMLVRCNKNSTWKGGHGYVPEGTIGRVISVEPLKVKWPKTSSISAGEYTGKFINLDLLTLPIASYLLND